MADQSGYGKTRKKGSSGRSYRNTAGLTRQPKKMRGRKVSSQRWLTRQLNDPFVAEAKSRGFRSRAALKLEQIDDRFQFLKPGMAVVDLGCAPGGWLQVSSLRTKLGSSKARLVGIDLLKTDGIFGADIFLTLNVGILSSKRKLETVKFGNENVKFEVDAFKKKCLLEGLDDIALSMEKLNLVENFEKKVKEDRPWLLKND